MPVMRYMLLTARAPPLPLMDVVSVVEVEVVPVSRIMHWRLSSVLVCSTQTPAACASASSESRSAVSIAYTTVALAAAAVLSSDKTRTMTSRWKNEGTTVLRRIAMSCAISIHNTNWDSYNNITK